MSVLVNILLVGVGGSAGAIVRNILSSAIAKRTTSWFSWGTLVVNIVACFVTGIIIPLAMDDTVHLIAVVGFLGGFSTLGTLNFNLAALWEAGKRRHFAIAFIANYLVTFIAALAGYALMLFIL